MKNYTIKPYEPGDYELWNTFLAEAKNATFLFHRDFMEYHSDRFEDSSFLVFEGKKLVALLPANRSGEVVFSHQGLTYGGLVYSDSIKLDAVIGIFKSMLAFLSELKIQKLQIKLIPGIYHRTPAHELEYALFLSDARIVRRDTLAVIDTTVPAKRSQIRERGIKKGKAAALQVREEHVFDDFWEKILVPNLRRKHDAAPVHTLSEIQILKSKFPENVRQFNVYHNGEIVGGATVFESENVAHIQYVSAGEGKNDLGTLDYLIAFLTGEIFPAKRFFDFGISNEQQGRKLNSGLSYWKESFGAHTVCQDFYEVETRNHLKLNDVFK